MQGMALTIPYDVSDLMAKGPEAKVKDDVKKYLTSIGAYFFMPVQTGYGASTLDFLVCFRGTFIGIETKAPGKKATARQRRVMQQIEAAGGQAFVATDVMTVVTELFGMQQ